MLTKPTNYAPAHPWILGALVALTAACEAVDHSVGAGTNDELLNPAGGGGNAADGRDNSEGGGGNGAGASDNAADGGGNGVNGSANATSGINVAVASVGGSMTGSNTTGSNGAWTDLPILDGCTPVRSAYDDAECELEIECGGTPMSSWCSAYDGYFECGCRGFLSNNGGFNLTGATVFEACSHALATCLTWRELEPISLECDLIQEADEPGYCFSNGSCGLEGVVGA